MKSEFMMKASRFVNRAGLKIKQHSPEILMVAGIAGTVASTVVACKATTKLSAILEETKETTSIIRDGMENGEIKGVEYTETDGQKDLTIVYAQTGIKIAKLYAPAIILGTISIASIVAGHNILKKRNIAIAAAYAAVDTGFKKYRKNVVERFGEELDKELLYNVKAKEIEVERTDKNGKKSVKKETIKVIDPLEQYSPYARFFTAGCPGWEKNAEYNLMYLRKQQQWANDILKSRGHLFLNEVYDELGIPRCEAGQVMGWIYDESRPKEEGDNYVDFGIYNANIEANRDFVNGYEPTIILDFNVDGNILDYLGK